MSTQNFAQKYGLTPTQYEVLVLVMEGFNNQEIADEKKRSLSWAKSTVSILLDKVGARDRSRMMSMLWQNGWGFKPAIVQNHLLPQGFQETK